ncbi:hypothetical protein LAZ67_5001223 [Cordylochernes scorpioides]|uniref:Uncharacterized protein n=1 Tax=Cordylochernes scorpioides TaxID=51811 RepID=A0ABY6KID6_9ARAC|nr:hypothetical protein LAZ67_5001223 [Cordylochernes scorpioides]
MKDILGNVRKKTASLNLEATTDDPELLKRVITGDETWIYGFDSETTQQASEWRFKNEPRPKKARKAPSKVKVMLTVFFDYQGIVHHEFQQHGSTITAELFHQFLVDMYAKVESERLRYITLHQRNLRAESYIHLRDALSTDANINPNSLGQRIILPSNFVNSPRTLLYPDVPQYYTWNSSAHEWRRRVQGKLVEGRPGVKRSDTIGRVYAVHIVNGSKYETFRETCAALGLLENDNHWVVTMDEAVLCQAPTRQLWITYRDEMASDILHRYQLLDSSIRTLVVVSGTIVVVSGTIVVVDGTLVVVSDCLVVAAGTLVVVADSLVVVADSLVVVADSLTVVAGTLVVVADNLIVVADSLVVVADSLIVVAGTLVVVAVKLVVVADSLVVVAGTMVVVVDSLVVADDSRVVVAGTLVVDADSLVVVADSLVVVADSLVVAVDSLVAFADSLVVVADSQVVVADSLVVVAGTLVVVAGKLVVVAESLVVVADSLVVVAGTLVVVAGKLVVVADSLVVVADSLVVVAGTLVVVAGKLVVVADSLVVVAESLVVIARTLFWLLKVWL